MRAVVVKRVRAASAGRESGHGLLGDDISPPDPPELLQLGPGSDCQEHRHALAGLIGARDAQLGAMAEGLQ
jgi:hypothetical protein